MFPDLRTARRLALAVARGRFRDQGATARGPLGLGTEFELIRDYQPDDDIRQVNWRATARLGRPMSNQYRLEQDRDLLLLIDAGRLSSAPLGEHGMTILDAELDAAAALAFVADELGDRCGAVAFDDEVRAALPPRRQGGGDVVRALFDLEPRLLDSDYELAFRRAEGSKRALVVVLCDLLEEAAARSLVRAVPVLTRRHAVMVGSPSDPALEALAAADAAGRCARPRRGRRSRATCSPRARARPRRSGRRARACSRRRRTGCRRRSSPPTCGPRPAPCSEPAVRATRRAPRTATNSEKPERGLDRDGQLRPGREALEEAAQHEPRHRARGELDGRDAPRAAATSPRRSAPGWISAQPIRSPATPPTTMHEISSGPCEEISRRNAIPLPAPIASPAIDAQDQPVEEQRPDGERAERDPAHERQERHLDVVEHDLERERRRGLGVEVAALGRRVGGRLELGRDQARGRRRVDQPPDRAAPPRAPSSSAQAASSSTGRSASRRQ